jgi:antitoxin component YwqK of YwqJK toxin-antitoxin module
VIICKTNSLGKRNGICKIYHDNGELWSEVNYIDGDQKDMEIIKN